MSLISVEFKTKEVFSYYIIEGFRLGAPSAFLHSKSTKLQISEQNEK